MKYLKSLLQQWNGPDAVYRPAPFWSWNARLGPSRLVRQIERIHKAGMGGAVMHSSRVMSYNRAISIRSQRQQCHCLWVWDY